MIAEPSGALQVIVVVEICCEGHSEGGGVTSHSRSPDGGECGIRVTQMEEMG